METIIFLAIFLTCFFIWTEKQSTKRLQENAVEYAKIVNQALWDKYGPGSKYAYFNAYLGRDYSQTGIGYLVNEWGENPWEAVAQTTEHTGSTLGFVAAPQAPQWFDETLDRTDDAVKQLQKAMDKGLYLAAPDEIDFATPHYRVLNFQSVQNAAKTLRHWAMRDWLRGNHPQAIDRLGEIIRFGNVLKAGPTLIEHLIRIAVLSIALDGIDFLTWANPTLQDNQQILTLLQQSNPQEWNYPPYMESWLYLVLDNWSYFSQFSPEQMAAFVLFEGTNDSQKPKEVDFALRKANIVPKNPLSMLEVSSILNKWTTLPTLRKRVHTVSPAVYETDPLLSPQDARKMPEIIYLASRYNSNVAGYNKFNADTRLEVAKSKALVLLAAYWARQWKDEHNRWPSLVEVYTECPFKYVEWIETADPTPLVNRFLSFHAPPSQHYYYPEKALYNERHPDQVFYPLPWPNTLYLHTRQDTKLHPKRTELVDWTMGTLQAFKPLVCSVTISSYVTKPFELFADPQYKQEMEDFFSDYWDETQLQRDLDALAQEHPDGKKVIQFAEELEIRLNLPQKSYWVAQPGPDKVLESEYYERHMSGTDRWTMYYPSNGIQSRGDIFQLVGWEY
jgi:hypothetical protein